MDARSFIRVSVSSLGLRVPQDSRRTVSCCICKIRLPNFRAQTAPVPLIVAEPELANPNPNRNSSGNQSESEPVISHLSRNQSTSVSNSTAASFYLDEPALSRLLSQACYGNSIPCLEVIVFAESQPSTCLSRRRKRIGSFRIRVSRDWAEGRPYQVHSGWISLGNTKSAELHLAVRVEPDPRFIFQFDGEPALCSQIIQTEGISRQPVFSCKFTRDRSSRGGLDDAFSGWTISSNTGNNGKERKERKGWLVMIHGLSGSPVAAASMVTPFVPSSGSDHVSRSNPGAWLILRPEPNGVSSWSPWGRLEAWREQSPKTGLGCRFQLVPPEGAGVNGSNNGILVSETLICAHKGGEFLIDTCKIHSARSSPIDSPQSSGDVTFNTDGFVMSCSIQGEGRSSKKRQKPVVQLAVRHVSCMEDAALFMALAAAVDLSMDACQPFSRKLRKELSDAISSN